MSTWIYNSNSGATKSFDSWTNTLADIWLHAGLGWHGPFNSYDEIVTYYNANKAANPGWKAPSTTTQDTSGDVTGNASNAISQAASDTVGNYNIGAWLLRIGEILLGLVLVGVGLAKLTGAENFVSRTVGKVPLPI